MEERFFRNSEDGNVDKTLGVAIAHFLLEWQALNGNPEVSQLASSMAGGIGGENPLMGSGIGALGKTSGADSRDLEGKFVAVLGKLFKLGNLSFSLKGESEDFVDGQNETGSDGGEGKPALTAKARETARLLGEGLYSLHGRDGGLEWISNAASCASGDGADSKGSLVKQFFGYCGEFARAAGNEPGCGFGTSSSSTAGPRTNFSSPVHAPFLVLAELLLDPYVELRRR